MYIVVDVKYMHTNFGGCGHSSFGYIATFHNCQISLYSQWSSKNLIVWNWFKQFMQVWIDVKFMHTNFGGCDFFGFGDIVTFKNGQISLSMVIKKFNYLESAQKIHASRGQCTNVLCMHTNFDGCRHSGFGDIDTFKNSQISLSDHRL